MRKRLIGKAFAIAMSGAMVLTATPVTANIFHVAHIVKAADEQSDEYVYCYAGLTWNEYWASEGVYAAGNDSTRTKALVSYGTKFAADNWMHKSNGIQLGLTDSIRCQLPENTDGTGYWSLTVYALGYEDYTVNFEATKDNIVSKKALASDEEKASLQKLVTEAESLKKVSGVAAYQIQYSTSKNFKKAKTVKVSAKSSSKVLKKLKKNKKYYVRVRSYKVTKVNNKSKNIYSAWSAKKALKTKKK